MENPWSERRLASRVSGCIAFETLHPASKVVLIAPWPSAYPVTGFPSRATTTTTTTTAATSTKPKTSATRHVAVKASRGRLVLEHAALEAARAAGEVVGSTVSHGAVPVSGPHIWTGTKAERWTTTTSPAKTSIVTTPIAESWLTASLARVSPLEVEVLAWPAVPISWSAHVSLREKNDG